MEYFKKIEKYLQLLEIFETDETAYADILHPEFIQTELPNALNKNGQVSPYSDIFRRMKLGKGMLSDQKYKIEASLFQGDNAYVESLWQGVMQIEAGPFKKGQKLTAHFCIAFEFKDGKIWKQRNYDCFDPF